ncbi:MAG: lysoplasmalogenase [Desulfatiglandaceae bacterium]
MPNILIIVLAIILMAGLLNFGKKDNRRGLVPTKTTLSLLFILAVVIQPHPFPSFYHFLLVGLIFCLGGDVFLALPQKRMFLLGLISFLIGHLLYVIAFFSAAEIGQWTWIGTLVAMVISGWVYLWLRPHLGAMNGPVLLYMIVITAMLSGAWSILGDSSLTLTGRVMIFGGAVLFYFSDIFVARDRFLKNSFLNRLVGLPMYYAGQFLLAFSVGVLV